MFICVGLLLILQWLYNRIGIQLLGVNVFNLKNVFIIYSTMCSVLLIQYYYRHLINKYNGHYEVILRSILITVVLDILLYRYIKQNISEKLSLLAFIGFLIYCLGSVVWVIKTILSLFNTELILFKLFDMLDKWLFKGDN